MKQLQKLCHLTEEIDLSKILTYVGQLHEIDTEGVEPCRFVSKYLTGNLREDVVEQPLSREQFLANAPEQIGGMIRIPPVLHTDS
jgi:aspartyl-tRNA(Asn)/glutamyl-tRNA(Gln) amidotransferase subunit C